MSELSNRDIILKNPKTTLLTTFTAILETGVQHIKDGDYRQIAVPLAPFIALIITIIFKTAYKRYKCNQISRMLNNWIKDLESEINNTHTSNARKKQVAKEISQYKNELKSVEKDFIGFSFD